jgi:transcription elongation factor GreA-like protein
MTMTLSQILALVGALDDSLGNETARERFRRFLKDNAKDVGQLRDYIQERLNNSGTQYNRALQDLANYIAWI